MSPYGVTRPQWVNKGQSWTFFSPPKHDWNFGTNIANCKSHNVWIQFTYRCIIKQQVTPLCIYLIWNPVTFSITKVTTTIILYQGHLCLFQSQTNQCEFLQPLGLQGTSLSNQIAHFCPCHVTMAMFYIIMICIRIAFHISQSSQNNETIYKDDTHNAFLEWYSIKWNSKGKIDSITIHFQQFITGSHSLWLVL